ncbi:uncharacterized protein LOC141674182 [Apium graveolens]|uniref:uncharacterized protein LOC141674182 n=1 Tax=Apium graveolens TaxID=4045 RepID=UPI003D7B88AA
MADAKEHVKRCDHCQKYAHVVRQPPEILTSINCPIPFSIWGMDILGPFPMSTAQRKFLIVDIDYFTKRVVAKPPTKITTKQVAQFLKYCEENEIDLRFTSVAHPQANGQAEVANRIILDGLQKRIEKSINNWVDEILPILWPYEIDLRFTSVTHPQANGQAEVAIQIILDGLKIRIEKSKNN